MPNLDTLKTEVLVIGSGPGGSVTAHVLAERGKDVVILEEGPHLPLESCAPFSLDEMTQKYRAGGLNPAMGSGPVAFVEACCVGGGSEINSALYHRTPDTILDEWRERFDLRQTSPTDLSQHFQDNETALSVGAMPGPAPLASLKLADGAGRMGWRSIEVPRCFRYDNGFGPDGVPIGVRQSMTKTFMAQAVGSGARLMPSCRVHRLRWSGKEWSVQATRGGQRLEISAGNVFVCAGALQTPLLLRRSGITRNVGNSLAMHPTVKVVAEFDEEVNHEQLGVPVHQVKEFSPRIGFGCSISSRPYLALALADYPGIAGQLRERWRHMAIYYAMITGPPTGRIRPVFDLPDPSIRYHLSDRDLRDLSTAMRRLAALLLAAGARRVYPSYRGARPIKGEDELSTIPGALNADRANVTTIHLFSSCPMGEDSSRCATDSAGRVHGVPNLIVNDASLICTAPGVNPQGTIMALARRNALHFLGEL
jgi:choline dehydrogenase-like flavoprotein